MSESGKVINIHNKREVLWYLSVSNDGIIFLAAETSVYQSTDDGISWSRVFESTDGWHCLQVIKMTTDHSDDFWAWESRYSSKHLHVYSVDRRHSNGNVTWKDIDVRTTNNKHIDLSDSSLSYDGNMNIIFLSDQNNQAVHVLSVNGQYLCHLLSSHYIANKPRRLAVDKERQLLYVGQDGRVVEVFKLTYGDERE